jgi:hypothetical protein
MSPALRLRHLAFLSPLKAPAIVTFGGGLNVVYGASDTGKSFIVDSIDFMLGGKTLPADIPESVGYDRVLLGVETLAGESFTLHRSVSGGAFRLYQGLHTDLPDDDTHTELADQHSDKRDDNLSAFLLSKIGLLHKRLRKNKSGDTQSLSFRNLARLVVVNEEEIIQKRSPLSDGSYIADTANTAAFKLLLTGVDDSAISGGKAKSPEEQSRTAQMELLEQLIGDYTARVRELAGAPKELEEQLEKLDGTMREQGEQLAISEDEYKEVSGQRRVLFKKIEEGQNRLTEITALLERFTLLAAHYRSDVRRLKAIEEAGSLFAALGEANCPLCGAVPEHHRKGADCDGDVDGVVEAARAEIAKIELRQTELEGTITTLRAEAVSFERRLPRLQAQAGDLSGRIEQIVAPNLRRLRAGYGELADKRGTVREALTVHGTLKDLQDRKDALERQDEKTPSSSTVETGLSMSVADAFASTVLAILRDWHFPEVERVHFDMQVRDLVINGKARTSFGKGLRAITQAAFTIGLMEYCRQHDTAHPGFVILDSPLLSYREPDGEGDASDDLRGTDVKPCFYNYLLKLSAERQIIIIENTDPPDTIKAAPQVHEFTRRHNTGRYGFFPVTGPDTDPPTASV